MAGCLAVPACVHAAVASTPLPAVLSINLCADQLVMLLADPGQVRALSALSRDEAGSYFLEKAYQFPQADVRAEDIIHRAPDVVITSRFSSRHTLSMLDELGIRVETLDMADSVEAMLGNIRHMGDILQQQRRAADLITSLRTRLAKIDARVALQNALLDEANIDYPRAAVYDANGYTVGANSLRGEAMVRAGWHNVASDMGIETYGVLQLEDMIRLAPQVLIESPYGEGTYSRAQNLTRHPALRKAGLNPLIVTVPSNQTICDGPWLVDVIENLANAREELLRQQTELPIR
ncbi:MAG: ABC transporter substrate-binding protein [Granulosicoccus sp.]|nr:ABC transporter substrate-binding protein [Granulosicoccus sp.]